MVCVAIATELENTLKFVKYENQRAEEKREDERALADGEPCMFADPDSMDLYEMIYESRFNRRQEQLRYLGGQDED